ncbi:MAG: DUF1844 domain-containing protein [Verrucomicrobiota bacterium]|jgi:hypothetical protein
MNSANPPSSAAVPAPAEARSALFANLVLQQTNMALMFLGKAPGPEGMTPPRDLEAASLFIDTLEMLAERTKGNLSSHEAEFLQQSLTTLRLYYVEAVEAPAVPPAQPGAAITPPSPASASAPESAKRFTKKY